MPNPAASTDERENRNRGRALGLSVAVALALLLVKGPHRGAGSVVAWSGASVFVVVNGWLAGRAAVATGRLPRGRGVRYGIASALLALLMLMPLASAVEVADGRKQLAETPISMFALLFFGLIPALLVGVLGGVALSAMVKPTAPRREADHPTGA